MRKSLIWIIPAILALIALFDMPYGYYQLLRVAIFCLSIFFAIREHGKEGEFWRWAFIACAIIYNPIFKLHLGRDIWMILNIVTAGFFLCHMWGRARIFHQGEKSL